MLSAEDILKIVENGISEEFTNSFPLMSNTLPGYPIPLYNSLKNQEYWLVPFLLAKKIRGVAILGLSGKLVSHGVLSPNIKDENRLIDLEFFERIPEEIMIEITNKYKEGEVLPPFLSYDETPRKWGWLVQIHTGNEKIKLIFIGPQGWYEKRVLDDREGF